MKTRKNFLGHAPSNNNSIPLDLLKEELRKSKIEFEVDVELNLTRTVKFTASILILKSIVVEVDWYAYHSDVETWKADMFTNNMLMVAGYKVLRYPAGRVVSNPRSPISDIRSLMEQVDYMQILK